MVENPEVSVDELAVLLAAEIPLFDVREPDEYVAGHVASAMLVPLGSVPSRVDEFPTDATVYVICKSGGRSARACEFLRAEGIDAVNVAGGTMGWLTSGRDVVVGEQEA